MEPARNFPPQPQSIAPGLKLPRHRVGLRLAEFRHRPMRLFPTNASSSVGPVPPDRARWWRWLLVVAGIVVGQFLLYGPSLLGRKILLPLDLLAAPGVYLPDTPEFRRIVPHDLALSDLVLQFETERRFVHDEYHAGRFPLWLPYQYAGVPLVWPRYPPFLLLACSTASPVILAWVQLAAALVAGLGAYAFVRRVLGLGFWAAAFSAWGYPLTGFFVFWQGFPTGGAVYWLPWLLLAVDRATRRPGAAAVAGMGGATALVLVSGHVDVAGQVLLVSEGWPSGLCSTNTRGAGGVDPGDGPCSGWCSAGPRASCWPRRTSCRCWSMRVLALAWSCGLRGGRSAHRATGRRWRWPCCPTAMGPRARAASCSDPATRSSRRRRPMPA